MGAITRIFGIMAFLLAVPTFAQEKEKDENRFMANAAWRLAATYPMQFGDHALNKSYEHGFGFGTQLYIISYQGFRFGGGFEAVQYKVADKQTIGNFRVSNSKSLYGLISYEKKFGRFSLMPQAGYGSCVLRNKSSNNSFGYQNGKEARIGVYAQYKTGEATYVFLGAHYIQSKYTINTTSEFIPYFGKAQQVQLSAGFLFD